MRVAPIYNINLFSYTKKGSQQKSPLRIVTDLVTVKAVGYG